MNDRQRQTLGFGWELIAEDFAEERMHDGVKSLFGETVAIVLRFPHVDVAQTTLRTFDGNVDDQALRWFFSEPVGDPLVEGGVNRDILREGVSHVVSPFNLLRSVFG